MRGAASGARAALIRHRLHPRSCSPSNHFHVSAASPATNPPVFLSNRLTIPHSLSPFSLSLPSLCLFFSSICDVVSPRAPCDVYGVIFFFFSNRRRGRALLSPPRLFTNAPTGGFFPLAPPRRFEQTQALRDPPQHLQRRGGGSQQRATGSVCRRGGYVDPCCAVLCCCTTCRLCSRAANSALWLRPLLVPTSPPQSVVVQSSTATQLDITWDPPPLDAQNGDIQGYKVWMRLCVDGCSFLSGGLHHSLGSIPTWSVFSLCLCGFSLCKICQ